MIGRFLAEDPVDMLSTGMNPGYFNRYMYTMNDPINAIDPDGMRVIYDFNTPQNARKVHHAIAYLSNSKTFRQTLYYLESDVRSRDVTINVCDCVNRYHPGGRIDWNPNYQVIDPENGTISSPASMLAHELRHAEKAMNGAFPDFDIVNAEHFEKAREEELVSTGYQNQVNSELNGAGANEGQRTGHHGEGEYTPHTTGDNNISAPWSIGNGSYSGTRCNGRLDC